MKRLRPSNLEKLSKAFDSCEDLVMTLAPRRAAILVGLLQSGLCHPQLNPDDPTHQWVKETAVGIQEQLAKQNPYIGEVLEIGWKESFLVAIECEEGHNPFGNFEQLSPAKKYRAALVYKALAVAISWLEEASGQSVEEVTATVFKLAEASLADNEYEDVPKLIKKFDEDKFIK